MPDVWAKFPELDPAMQERLADVLETRGADPQQREMRQIFLAGVPFPTNAHVLEVGCGTGVLTRALALWPDVSAVVGVDVAPSLLTAACISIDPWFGCGISLTAWNGWRTLVILPSSLFS